uniref:Non-structural protein NS-S n=1 Tax=Enseada virus TaxID=1821545 RepID=A0A7D9MVP0_9VIRU|nr:NSs [Enseada virus]
MDYRILLENNSERCHSFRLNLTTMEGKELSLALGLWRPTRRLSLLMNRTLLSILLGSSFCVQEKLKVNYVEQTEQTYCLHLELGESKLLITITQNLQEATLNQVPLLSLESQDSLQNTV